MRKNAPLLEVRDLRVHFPIRTGGLFRPQHALLKAVDGISFDLDAGETLAIVGESGCGKSTLGRAILRLVTPTSGRVLWQGEDLASLDAPAMRKRRRDLQIVFQDPMASLDPRMTVGEILAEPLRALEPGLARAERRARVAEMLDRVGLDPAMVNRYPHEFSGGQCQRIGIARAMILRPKLVICDEPVSALDVSVQAQILDLLRDLQRDFGLSYIFISHDLAVVQEISRRVMVLYLGRVMEIAPSDAFYRRPLHPYARALLDAVPVPDPGLGRRPPPIAGDLPSPMNPPSGCVFRTRCPHATERCAAVTPALEDAGDGRRVACHYWREIAAD
ncbi:MAG TPA: dipeptide ABC transporter ATP-binding protein [Sphingomonadales bacterium]